MSKEYLESLEWLLANEMIYRGRTRLPISSALRDIKHRLESIDNANPSEALECLEFLDKNCCCFALDEEYEAVNTIKQALLKAEENARSEEILQKYYQEGITLDSVRALKKENAELRQKAQEPKQYLKWEDLEFKEEEQTMKVKLNNNIYTMFYYSDEVCFDTVSIAGVFIDCCNYQFFNDLHLERVEE